MVGGSHSSDAGSTANRPITSSAAAAFSAGTVTRPYPVSIHRRPVTSATESRSGRTGGVGATSGRTGS